LERLAMALLEFETIDGYEVEMLVNGAAVKEIEKIRSNKKDGGVGIVIEPEVTGDKKPSSGSGDPVGGRGPVTV
jgi:cell division protease FtsH